MKFNKLYLAMAAAALAACTNPVEPYDAHLYDRCADKSGQVNHH